MRAVLDVNVIISALLSPEGSPARVLRAWIEGRFELVLSPLLLAELKRALAYPKLRKRITAAEAARVIEWLGGAGSVTQDPRDPPRTRSPDPDDDYLIALASGERAVLVSGDNHLLGLSEDLPIVSPARFLAMIE